MAEKCGKCNQSDRTVDIGGRSYCASCGEPSTPSIGRNRSMQDLGARAISISAKPSSSLHDRTGLAKGGVIDLRSGQLAEKPTIKPIRRQKPASKSVQPDRNESSKPVVAEPTRSDKISRFHIPKPKEEITTQTPVETAKHSVVQNLATSSHHRTLPAHAETHHRAMAKLVTHSQKHPNHRSKATFGLHRYAAASLAVLIMGAYVWMQNYPKLELHSASSKAGFALTLPSYLPSSYSLSGPVEASNGSATIAFKSPTIADKLKITQKVTTWDSSTLRDNFVANATSDYTSVQGQGLTIYLWGSNQAAWVNHGIWYGIEGASNLSREQILKIAYSL